MSSLDAKSCYKAVKARDRRYDGRFFTCVHTTGIYCRPVCPARLPLFKNVSFVRSAAEAEEKGYRPCKRCRPETATSSAAWQGTSATVSRAYKLIHQGYLQERSIDELASALGVTDRHLRGLFSEHLGASPIAIDISRRLDFARNLLDQTTLPVTEVAFTSGFASVRRFNDAFKKRYSFSPTEIRARKKTSPSGGAIELKIHYRPPYDWDSVLAYLGQRLIDGVESVAQSTYRRTFEGGAFEVSNSVEKSCLCVQIFPEADLDLMNVVLRIRRVFDVDADPIEIQNILCEEKSLRSIVNQFPGLRVPGAWDGFEIAVRAVVGQLISIEAAAKICSRLTEKYGEDTQALELSKKFPTPERLASARMNGVGLTQNKIRSIRALAKIVMSEPDFFERIEDVERFRQRLLEVHGIGEWTVQYILLRLSEADAFPETDLIIRKQIEKDKIQNSCENCRPWRSYATVYLWRKYAEAHS